MSTTTSPLRSWLRRAVGLAVFCLIFVRELVLANMAVAKTVLFQRVSALKPGFVHYSIEGLSAFEVLMLTQCITLTPGTTSVEVAEDRRMLVVHALDAADPAAVCEGIKRTLEAPILAWTR